MLIRGKWCCFTEMAFLLHKTTHAPTGVEHCIESHFISSQEQNLIVAQSSELLVYRLVVGDEVCHVVTLILCSPVTRALSSGHLLAYMGSCRACRPSGSLERRETRFF